MTYGGGLADANGQFIMTAVGLDQEVCNTMVDEMPKTGPKKDGQAYPLKGMPHCNALFGPYGRKPSVTFTVSFCIPSRGLPCPAPANEVRRMN